MGGKRGEGRQGWVGSGVGGGGGGWEAEGRLKQPSSSAVPSVWDLNWYDPQSGPRLPL